MNRSSFTRDYQIDVVVMIFFSVFIEFGILGSVRNFQWRKSVLESELCISFAVWEFAENIIKR